MGAWMYSNGPENVIVHGMLRLVKAPQKWPFGYTHVGQRSWMSLGRKHMFLRGIEWASRSSQVGTSTRVPMGSSTCAQAARGGHLETLKWLRAHGCPWNIFTCLNAAEKGHLHILKWLREQAFPWPPEASYYAGSNGHLDVLKWMREQDCPWDIYFGIAIRKQPHVVAWAKEQGFKV